MYRVHLWLVAYKLYLAQEAQSEPITVDDALERIYIPGDVRDVLRLVCEAPSTIVMILDCKKSQLSLTISFLNRRKPVNLKDVHLLFKS